jgi:4,5-dihydroxyphthalate decarboxylase
LADTGAGEGWTMTSFNTLLGNHPHLMPLKTGAVLSPDVTLDFADEPVPHEAFKPFVRNLAFDCGELAIVTFLQARAYGKPFMLLPATVSSRFHQGSIFYNADRGAMGPKDIEGRSVVLRTYSQTTCLWVRGVLKHEYGVDNDKVTWLTLDESHLAEYRDPPNCRPAGAGKDPVQMLRDGEVAAAIPISLASRDLHAPPFRTLVPDPARAARQWYERTGIVPLNHLVVVRTDIARVHPGAVRAFYRMILEAKEKSGVKPADGIDMLPMGIDRLRRSLEMVVQMAVEQKLIPQAVAVDDLFADFRAIMG